MAVHSLVTIEKREVTKWSLRNVLKWPIFTQRVTFIKTDGAEDYCWFTKIVTIIDLVSLPVTVVYQALS